VDDASVVLCRGAVLEKGQVAYKGAKVKYKFQLSLKHGCKGLVDTYWTRLLEPMLRNIDGILEVGFVSLSLTIVC